MHYETSMWGKPPAERGPEGLNLVAKSAGALVNAARQLAQMPGAEKLKVRSGEHIVAILLAAHTHCRWLSMKTAELTYCSNVLALNQPGFSATQCGRLWRSIRFLENGASMSSA